MPFTGPNDPNLPANIKNLPANKKSQFVKVFNSSFANCQRSGGGGCEAVAFKFANGAVKSSESDLKPMTSRIDDYFSVDISEESFDKTGKKEVLVTLLKEGPGNKFHNNYYTRGALNSALKEVLSRPKQYYNHAKDIDNPDRDLRDWASSIQEAWVDTDEPKAKLKARVKVLDNWLWERAKSAPEELAVSIEGKGAGKEEVIEGQPYHAIYEIQHVNGVNWVDYPGNAGMGVQVLEKDKSHAHDNKEEDNMTFKDILEGMKGLSSDELKEMAVSRPEMKEFFMFGPPEQDEKTKGEIAELKESLKTIKTEAESKSKEFSEKVIAIEKEKSELANKVEAHEIKGKEMEKEKLVEKMLSASKLKEEHKTDTFKKQLISCEKEEAMKVLIEDREKICVVKEADPSQPGAGSGGNEVAENDQHKEFALNVFGAKIEDDDVKAAVAGGIE